MSRAFVVVLDACGVGALPDAADYGDAGANTFGHLAHAAGGLSLPTLGRLGLGSILELEGVPPSPQPVLHGRLHALGPGKDSTAGHWELMGVVMAQRLPTYPGGFPREIIDLVSASAGRGVVCNRPCNGIEAIHRCGGEHLRSGSLIVYTSQDSVLQIAAHVDVVVPEELYRICREVRERLAPEHAVGRVIARPFQGAEGEFTRTAGRRDFSVKPPSRSYLEEVQAADIAVHTVGKTGQLFAGVGVDVEHPGATNAEALAETTELIGSLDRGLVFTNLVETDQVYGHRHDVQGFHRALREIDASVADWLKMLRSDDLLILTADHGCDVTSSRTDHTREHVPLLAVFERERPGPLDGSSGRAAGEHSLRHDGPLADVGASVLSWLTDREAPDLPGDPFI